MIRSDNTHLEVVSDQWKRPEGANGKVKKL